MQLERQDQISDLLQIITDQLDLPREEFALAIRIYEDLGQWIKQDSQTRFQADSLIYPFGSMSLGTVVKSITKNDTCDLDLIYRRELSKTNITQDELMEQVGEQLKAYIDEKSKEFPNLELCPWPQCWTIKYGEVFNLDIVPAIPDDNSSEKYTHSRKDGISTTDGAEYFWQYSNPKGFIKWFEEQDQVMLKEATESLRQFTAMDTKSEVEVEELSTEAILSIKTPLKRAIQIMKRHRDTCYRGKEKYKPSSIIITTLAAKIYNNESNIKDALVNITQKLSSSFDSDGEGNIAVFDPICNNRSSFSKNNYAKDWVGDPGFEAAFSGWSKDLENGVKNLYNTEFKGLNKIADSLSGYFGSTLVERSVKAFGDKAYKKRQSGGLLVTESGLLNTSIGTKIKKHTFFGK